MKNKDIVCFDIETTGLNYKPGEGQDYIIQLAAIKFDRNTFEIKDKRNWYIKPQHNYTITPGAFEAHHISKEWLDENGDSLIDVAPIFLEFIEDCDILTYNGNRFDVQFISKDLALCGYELPMEGRRFYDAFALECKKNPRDLSTIFKKYTGRDLEDAHNAFNDVQATIEVFKHQMTELDTSYDSIDDWDECNLLTPDGTIIRKTNLYGEQVIVFNTGKYKDVEFMKVFHDDFGYIKWYMDKVASNYTKRILRQYYKEQVLKESQIKK